MLWVPEARQTRRGTVFSPFRVRDFDFAPLLAKSVSKEHEGQEDHEDRDEIDAPEEAPAPSQEPTDALNDVDDAWPPPPPPDPLDEVDACNPNTDRTASPPTKRRRTAVEAMCAGTKPLTGSHRRRQAKRLKTIQQKGQAPSPSVIRKHVKPAQPLQTSLDTEALPAAHGGYGAKAEDDKWGSKKRCSLPELILLGINVVPWNGFDPRPLVDANGRVFAALVGQPRDPTYAASVAAAYDLITKEGFAAAFPSEMRKHRRGLFAAMNVGLTYGKGQTAPSWLNNGVYSCMADRLLADPNIQRMAAFASASFALWAPRLYGYYRAHDVALRLRLPHLRRPFDKSVFSCAAFNFGPNVWTFRHRDVCNLPFGWCAIQSAGPFDPTKGGHLVLWDLKLAIEFPAGALILVPSATISHSNVPVQDGDERISFTQFTAGGLMRYVDNGFRTERVLEEGDPEEFERLSALKGSRWEMGLGLLSTLDELVGPEVSE